MRTNPEAAAHMREAAKIARFDAHLYEVAFIDHASMCRRSRPCGCGRAGRRGA